jgi:hypothetical protein
MKNYLSRLVALWVSLLVGNTLVAQVGWIQHQLPPTPGSLQWAGVACADFDGDQDIDTVGFTWSGHFYFLENDGLANFTVIDRGDIASIPQITTGDIDGDGDIDLIGCGWLKGGPLEVVIGKNDGFANFTWRGVFQFPASNGLLCLEHLSDLDGDMDLDLVIRDSLDSISVLENLGNGSFQYKNIHYAPSAIFHYLLSHDLESDGDWDVIICDERQELVVLVNDGLGSFQPHFVFQGLDTDLIAVADMNQDGIAEILMRMNDGYGARLSTWSLSLLGTFQQTVLTSIAQSGYTRGSIFDFNGDGHFDFVSAGSEYNLIYVPRLMDGCWRTVPIDGKCDRVASPVDLDQDGDHDLIAWNPAYISWFENVPLPEKFRLFIDQPGQRDSFRVILHGGTPNDRFFTALSTDPRNATHPGGGNFYGLFISPSQLQYQFSLSQPHRGQLDVDGNWVQYWPDLLNWVTYGRTFYAVSIHWTPGQGNFVESNRASFTVD